MLVDKSMIGKMNNISFIGNWDFARAYVLRQKALPRSEVLRGLQSIFSLSAVEAGKLYSQVHAAMSRGMKDEIPSQRLSFFHAHAQKGRQAHDMVYFNNGVVFDRANVEARIFSPVKQRYLQYGHLFLHDGQELVYQQENPSVKMAGGLFFKHNEDWRMIGLSPELGRSFFVKAFFLRGSGLDYFEPFYADDQAGIYIYKINWPKLK